MPAMKTLIYLAWASTVVTKALYLLIGLSVESPTAEGAQAPMILVVMGSIGVLGALAGALLSRQIYTNPKIYTSKLAPPVYIAGMRVPNNTAEGRLFSYALMCLGMAETAAVFGLVGSLMKGNHAFLYAMIGVSLGSWLLQCPRYREFETNVLAALRNP